MTDKKYELAPWMKVAESYLGVKELSGSKHNSVIVKFFSEAGHPEIKDDETAWCSAFANGVMYESNYSGTRNLMARSWLKAVNYESPGVPRFGDIVIFSRGNSNVYGHVAFFISWDSNYVTVLGGNQSDSVSITKIPRSKLLGFRRPTEKAFMDKNIPKMTTKPSVEVKPEDVGMISIGAASALTAAQGNLGMIIFAIAILFVFYQVWKRS